MTEKDREELDRFLQDGQCHKESYEVECVFCGTMFWCTYEIEYGAIASETVCPNCEEESK